MISLASRVKETSTTTGTGTLNLGGAVDGTFQTFVSGVADGATVYYVIVHQGASEWETGIGTVTSGSPDTLSRDTVLESSNAGSAVNLSSGTKHVFLDVLGAHGPGFLLIDSTDIDSGSPVAAVDFTLPPAFDAYELRWFHVEAANAGPSSGVHYPSLRFSTDGGSTFDSGTNYDRTSEDTSSTGQAQIQLARQVGFNDDLSDSHSAGRAVISNVNQTGQKPIVHSISSVLDRGSVEDQYMAASYTVTTGSVDALRFFLLNADVSGHFRLYGVR